MNRGVHCESPRRAHEPGVSLVGFGASGNLHPGMQIKWNVQVGHGGPEGPVFGNIKVDCGIRSVLLRETIDQGALETEILDAADEFLRSGIGILHGEGCKSSKVVWMSGNRLGHTV